MGPTYHFMSQTKKRRSSELKKRSISIKVMENQRGHVLVLTYPAQGHINPLLQFAKRLAFKGLKTTLATTTYTLNSIQPSTLVGVEPISDGFDQGGFKQAPSIEAYLESFKTVGSKTLTELVLKLNALGSPVNCIVYDSLLPWALDVAQNLGVYAAVFFTNSASVCSLYIEVVQGDYGLPVIQENGQEIESAYGTPIGFEDLPSFLAFPSSYPAYLDAILDQLRSLDKNEWAFCNTFYSLEEEVAEIMKGRWWVEMIGPMVPSAYLDQQIDGDTSYGANLWGPTNDQCLEWLHEKQPKSVIYASLGSMADIPARQVEELAFGLKASNRPFLWVLREAEKKLPAGFLESVGVMGLVVPWCNQVQVLAHQAVGCFVTHCGWNSTIEGISLGVPMVAVPQWSDQPMNAKFVADAWEVGMRAKRDGEGIVTREELEKCIKDVMVGERSEEIKRNAFDWSRAAKEAAREGGTSDYAINEFVKKLQEGKKA